MNEYSIEKIIKQLQTGELSFFDVPEEYRNNLEIVEVERNLGIRKSIKKGYDIIRKNFFVEEHVLRKYYTGKVEEVPFVTYFEKFSNYFEFLQGDIYQNACYYQYKFSRNQITKYDIDMKKINCKALIDYTIDDFSINYSADEINEYSHIEQEKNKLKKWIKRISCCDTYDSFKKTVNNFKKIYESDNLFNLLLYSYVFHNKENAFDFAIQFSCENYNLGLERFLCLVYEPNRVMTSFNPIGCSLQTVNRYKQRLQKFIKQLNQKEIVFSIDNYFDDKTHFWVYHCIGRLNTDLYKIVEIYKYFDTFEEFSNFLDNDLSNCDLSKAIIDNLDLSKCKTNEKTILPIKYQCNLTYEIKKWFDRRENSFIVEQHWINENQQLIKQYRHTFGYFFEFAYFLKYDLSDAELVFCDGLENIIDFSQLNLQNAKVRSIVLDKLGIDYEKSFVNVVESFQTSRNNEITTSTTFMTQRPVLSFEEELKLQKIYYISDIHLWHRLKNADCQNLSDSIYVIQAIIDRLLVPIQRYETNLMLIGGDTASDFSLFKLFVERLRKSVDEKKLDVPIVFLLGNHELWDFAGNSMDEIVGKYRTLLRDNGMYLIQNELLIKFDGNEIEQISIDELNNISKEELNNRLSRSRVILLGGLGFSGCNKEFNAKQGIYRQAIDREQEIAESKIFANLYDKVCNLLPNKRVIVFTHTPQTDWCSHNTPHKQYVYVSGHTHRNFFHDDGDYRIYADNQIGYYQNNCILKHFYLEDDYDIFANYEDGIYEITREDYAAFNHGKHIGITFSRNFSKLYMLKKDYYYMFILESANGNLNILNGGAMKRLPYNSVRYYFETMNKIIEYLKAPLEPYSQYQRKIADLIKSFGGSGTIHGAIIDIDFFNHIYVNPLDSTITPYFAYDMQNKVVFRDVETLLQENSPELYAKYIALLQGNSSAQIILKKPKPSKKCELYLDTDIYKASREIKKMQKLHSNILSVWIEPQSLKITDGND